MAKLDYDCMVEVLKYLGEHQLQHHSYYSENIKLEKYAYTDILWAVKNLSLHGLITTGTYAIEIHPETGTQFPSVQILSITPLGFKVLASNNYSTLDEVKKFFADYGSVIVNIAITMFKYLTGK